jgi:two-component system, NarL family, sensor histidine kinase DesK
VQNSRMSCEAEDGSGEILRTRRRLRVLVLAYLLIYPVPWLFHLPSTAALLGSIAGLAVFLPLYFFSYRVQGARKLLIAAAMLAIGLALEPCRGIWGVFAVYAAASVGNARPPRIAAIGVAGVVAVTALFSIALHLDPMDWGWSAFFAATLGTATIFSSALNLRNEQLAQAREDVRQYAVIAERERIARDLHDVLGHTLTLVAVKADLARKLIERDPEAARREIDEIHRAARASLGEVRAAVTGMRSTTLAAELLEARRALESAGISVESATPAEPLPPLVETALAYVIREAATNVVRHSGAHHCRIMLTREAGVARLAIHDDGRGGALIEGHGLAGMRQRLAAIRGALEVRGDSGVSIEARAPLAESSA